MRLLGSQKIEPVLVQPLVTELPAADVLEAVDLLERLRAQPDRGGLALLESAGGGAELSSIRRTILLLRSLLRLEIRGNQVQVEPMVEAGEALVKKLPSDLAFPGGSVAVLEDQERLRSPSVLDAMRLVAGLIQDRTPAPLPAGLFGAFSYELVDQFEHLPPRPDDPLDEPDASFVLASDMLIEDHRKRSVFVVTRGLPWESARGARDRHERTLRLVRGARRADISLPDASVEPAPVEADVTDQRFLEMVREFKRQIGAGEIFQGVLSRGLETRSSADPLRVYRELRRRNPSPYMFYLELREGVLLGASPETFLRVEDGYAEIRPIAGTVARGRHADGSVDPDLDGRLALSLQLDPKEQAEHAMLLDLARNDIARVSVPGTTEVLQQMAIEKFSHVQHLVSRVRGQVRPDLDALHVYRAAANMGTLTGAPKVRAMELIREAETTARGFYGGAAGYLLADGRFDSCIVIRSLRYERGVYYGRAGAGVVFDSDPERELLETEKKSLACRV
ncbi:MAG: chorismate-binding protein, partial [Planctomycetota bacterium]